MAEFNHLDEHGNSRMVDISEKAPTTRVAIAHASIVMKPETLKAILDDKMKKGNVLNVAQLAGIQAAKQATSLIPLAHPILISGVKVDFEIKGDNRIDITAEAKCTGQTGIEMEALVSASTAALTIYDMCKAIDRGMTIEGIYLMHKSGGKSGVFNKE